MSILRICNLILLCSLMAGADTVTTRDSRSWNGDLQTMQNGVLTLSASFPNSTVSLVFGPTMLRAIEFNPTRFNPGTPPSLSAANGSPLNGTVYLTDKSGHRCQNIMIDSQNVRCGDGTSWPRQNVMRILFDQ